MKPIQSQIACLCVLLVAAPWTAPAQEKVQRNAQDTQQQDTQAGTGAFAAGLESAPASHWYSRLSQPYQWRNVAPVNLANSSRLDRLMRGGNLYLSLRDAIDLALENNIDIEIQRYGFDLADTDLFRARATGNIAGIAPIPGTVNGFSTAPTSLTSSIGTTNVQDSFGALPTAAELPPLALLNDAPLGYDPVLQSTVLFGHQTTPEENTITTGTSSLVGTNRTANISLSQSFLTGTTGTFTYSNLNQNENALFNVINPATTSSFDLQITQHLLQGRSFAVNNRPIRIAKINQKVNDLVFEQQVINTVANVEQLYWSLVSAIENVEVAEQAVNYSLKLLDDNQKQVDVGTLAPVEVTRARAELASDRGNLITAQTLVLQQETILKTALSRTGASSPELASARVIPTDRIEIPQAEPSRPAEDMVQRALAQRPELQEAALQIDSFRINIEGTRANLLPQVDAIADLRNNALTGSVNPLSTFPAPSILVGGYSNALSQLFYRDFPNYSIGVNVTIPLRNRAAEANMATAQVNLRMTEQSIQRMKNLIRLDVQNALIALDQVRIKFEAAVEQVAFETELLDAENKKLSIGTSTPLAVILVQRDLSNAELTQVQAVTAYALAKVQLDQAVGSVLETNHVEIAEARSGRVASPPSPIPDAAPGGGPAQAPRQLR
jgi:outer membrane protein